MFFNAQKLYKEGWNLSQQASATKLLKEVKQKHSLHK